MQHLFGVLLQSKPLLLQSNPFCYCPTVKTRFVAVKSPTCISHGDDTQLVVVVVDIDLG